MVASLDQVQDWINPREPWRQRFPVGPPADPTSIMRHDLEFMVLG